MTNFTEFNSKISLSHDAPNHDCAHCKKDGIITQASKLAKLTKKKNKNNKVSIHRLYLCEEHYEKFCIIKRANQKRQGKIWRDKQKAEHEKFNSSANYVIEQDTLSEIIIEGLVPDSAKFMKFREQKAREIFIDLFERCGISHRNELIVSESGRGEVRCDVAVPKVGFFIEAKRNGKSSKKKGITAQMLTLHEGISKNIMEGLPYTLVSYSVTGTGYVEYNILNFAILVKRYFSQKWVKGILNYKIRLFNKEIDRIIATLSQPHRMNCYIAKVTENGKYKGVIYV